MTLVFKILKKHFGKIFDKFIEKYKLLSDDQYGFRVGRSTSVAVMKLVENITQAIDNKEYMVEVT